MVTASLRSDANLIIPGRKVVVSGPANLEEEEKAKAKGKTKEKEKGAEEVKERDPLCWFKRKATVPLNLKKKEARQ